MEKLRYKKSFDNIKRGDLALSIGGDNYCYDDCPENTHKIFIDNYKCIEEVPENFFLDNDIFLNSSDLYHVHRSKSCVNNKNISLFNRQILLINLFII